MANFLQASPSLQIVFPRPRTEGVFPLRSDHLHFTLPPKKQRPNQIARTESDYTLTHLDLLNLPEI